MMADTACCLAAAAWCILALFVIAAIHDVAAQDKAESKPLKPLPSNAANAGLQKLKAAGAKITFINNRNVLNKNGGRTPDDKARARMRTSRRHNK